MMTSKPDEMFPSKIMRVATPDATIFVTVIEKHDGTPFRIFISAGKAGSAVGAWAQAVELLASKLLVSGQTISDLIEALSEITSDRRRTDHGVSIRSGVEGFVRALHLYRAGKFEETCQLLGIRPEDFVEGRGASSAQ